GHRLRASRVVYGRDLRMAGTRVRPRLPPAPHRECELASSREEATQSAEISPQQLAQTSGLPWHANGARARRTISPIAALRQYQCDRFPPPQWPTTGPRHRPEPGARLVRWFARDQATSEQSRNRRSQMLVSVRM